MDAGAVLDEAVDDESRVDEMLTNRAETEVNAGALQSSSTR